MGGERAWLVRLRSPGHLIMRGGERDKYIIRKTPIKTSVADPDPGSGAFLTPGSGIRNRLFPDPGSQTHIFESLKFFENWPKFFSLAFEN